MNFYTADLHIGHKNIIKYENRPFKDLAEMEEAILDNWNTKVRPNDDVYILGDVAFVGKDLPLWYLQSYLWKLNGRKHLILGNHDTFVKKEKFNEKVFVEIVPYKEIIDTTCKLENNNIIMCHYPIEEWNGKIYNSIHLHGHIHSDPIMPMNNRYNVGVDVCNFTPVTLKEVLNGINK